MSKTFPGACQRTFTFTMYHQHLKRRFNERLPTKHFPERAQKQDDVTSTQLVHHDYIPVRECSYFVLRRGSNDCVTMCSRRTSASKELMVWKGGLMSVLCKVFVLVAYLETISTFQYEHCNFCFGIIVTFTPWQMG